VALENKTNFKTEEEEMPGFWKWFLIVLCLFVVIALAATGLFYYFRGGKEHQQPRGVPRSRLIIDPSRTYSVVAETIKTAELHQGHL